MTAPTIPVTPVLVADDDTLRKLLKACEGKEFVDRRDMAMIRLLVDSGLRRGELAGMTVDDLDLERDLVHVIGKGRRPRAVPFGAKTGQALDRYMRTRAIHSQSSSPALWLGIRGPVTGSGVAQILETRCAKAGIERLHPHQLRHVFAHRWLADGNGETDLMALTGWRSRAMLSRYAASAAAERARDPHRRAALGDRL
jgi:site-specific recombinase XerD